MYESHFGLTSRPFTSKAAGATVFVGPGQAETITAIHKGLQARDAVVTITGPVGSGKTTIVNRALETMSPGRVAALVGRINVSAEEILELLLAGFGFAHKTNSTLQRFVAFRRCMNEQAARGVPIVIVVEDARRLGVTALAEIEALTASDTADGGGANLVLMGEDGLNEMLSHPDLARLKQRIRRRQQVKPLNEAEVRGYLKNAIREAGGHYDSIFGEGVGAAVAACSDGVPRMINTLAESALAAAADDGERLVSAARMYSVAAELFGYEGSQPGCEPAQEAPAESRAEAAQEATEPDTQASPESLADVVDRSTPETANKMIVEFGRYPEESWPTSGETATIEPPAEESLETEKPDVASPLQALGDEPTLSNIPGVLDDEPTLSNIPGMLDDEPTLTNIPAVLDDEPTLTNIPGVLDDEPTLTNIPGVLDDEPTLTNIPEVLDDEPTLTNIPEVLDDVPTLTNIPHVFDDEPTLTHLPEVFDDKPTNTDIPDLINDTQPGLASIAGNHGEPDQAGDDGHSGEEEPDAFDLDAVLSPDVESTNLMPGITAELDRITMRANVDSTAAPPGDAALDDLPTLSDSMRVHVAEELQEEREDSEDKLPEASSAADSDAGEEEGAHELAVEAHVGDDQGMATGVDPIAAPEANGDAETRAVADQDDTPEHLPGATTHDADVGQDPAGAAEAPQIADTESAFMIEMNHGLIAEEAPAPSSRADAAELTGDDDPGTGCMTRDDTPTITIDEASGELQIRPQNLAENSAAANGASVPENVDERTSEPFFGDEFAGLADALLTEGRPIEPGPDEASEQYAGIEEPAALEASNDNEDGPIDDQLGAGSSTSLGEMELRDSVALRIEILNRIKERLYSQRTEVVELGEDNPVTPLRGPQPEPIERQINNSMTQTLEALKVARAADAVAETRGKKKSGGLLSRLLRSS